MTFTPPLMIEMLKHNLHWTTSAQIKTITEQWDNHPLSERHVPSIDHSSSSLLFREDIFHIIYIIQKCYI
jgi:hypothetical protein